jgi:hypothetical protein
MWQEHQQADCDNLLSCAHVSPTFHGMLYGSVLWHAQITWFAGRHNSDGVINIEQPISAD